MKKSLQQIIITLIFIFISTISKSQLTDNHSTYRTLQSDRYFRFHYDNDFFTKADEYYTQGITWEYVHPSIKKFPLSTLLFKPYAMPVKYGLSLNLFGYTPTSILSDNILLGDRPFDANITLKTFLIQADSIHKQQVSTAISIGVMGPAALGFQIQYNIHKWLKNPLPHGWQYQIKNDIILNYQVNYEKQLIGGGNNFLLNTTAEARLGTLNDKVSGGFNFMAGRFNKKYSGNANRKRKTEYYFYNQHRLNFIGYDATLQGGLLNRNSPYTISAKEVSRITYQADAGIIVNFKKLYLSYTQSFLSKEFTSGHSHRWGGVSVGFTL